jgi:DNA polymerase III subunit delta'
MTEDAQSAFLKTLEEPPPGTVLLLTAADEERLLPTIRSRTSRIRLGPVARPDVERLLIDAGLADATLAARLARLAAGRPGDAVALARAPEAVTIRAEVGRTLLDLTAATRADRLRLGRDLLARAGELAAALRAGARSSDGAAGDAARPGRGRKGAARGATSPSTAAGTTEAEADASGPAAKVPAAERRAAALTLVGIWRDIARDLALVAIGERADVRELDLLDDLDAAAARLPAAFPAAQLRRLDIAGERLEGNVSPELVVDALALGWAA